jgi:hypothetical protein
MKKINFLISILLLAVSVLINACSNNEDVIISPKVNLVIQINHLVDDQPLQLNNRIYRNAFGNTYSIETLKYFISHFELSGEFDEEILVDEVHYVDITSAKTLRFKSETTIPLLDYTNIKLVYGLNEADNVTGAFPNPPENNMEWPIMMGGGYHYMKLEGKFDSAAIVKNYQTHTGPTNGNQNYISLDLPITSITNTGDELILQLNYDLNKWYEKPNTIDLNDMKMIMPNQEKQMLLKENGQNTISF